MMPDFQTAEERTKWIIDHADYFTAVRFLGRGHYERHEFPSISAACQGARRMSDHNGGRYLIYAVAGIHDTFVPHQYRGIDA